MLMSVTSSNMPYVVASAEAKPSSGRSRNRVRMTILTNGDPISSALNRTRGDPVLNLRRQRQFRSLAGSSGIGADVDRGRAAPSFDIERRCASRFAGAGRGAPGGRTQVEPAAAHIEILKLGVNERIDDVTIACASFRGYQLPVPKLDVDLFRRDVVINRKVVTARYNLSGNIFPDQNISTARWPWNHGLSTMWETDPAVSARLYC